MRLIDATALKESMEEHVTSMSVCLNMSEHYGMVSMKEQCIEDVNAAPTIDAIPVEWLEEQRDKLSEAWDEEWHEINGLIEQWREEQEGKHATDRR